MDPSRSGNNNQQWQRYTGNANNANSSDGNSSEEKNPGEQNLSPSSDTMTAQYVLQQNLIQQMHDEQRQNRQRQQIYQFLQHQQREAQLRRLLEQEVQSSGLVVGELPMDRAALLQMQLRQHQLEQQRRQQEEQEIRLRNQRILQQRLLREQLINQTVDRLQRERNELSMLHRANPASQYDVGSFSDQSLFEDTRAITSTANIAAVDSSVPDISRVDTDRQHPSTGDVSAFPGANSPQALLLRPWSETSAELLKKMETELDGSDQTSPKKKSSSRKKSADMPKRPLHAYNIFFQQERQAILANLPEPTPDTDAVTKGKRRRRATHGKISFASLAKEIGQKWQTLDKEEKERFQHLAEIDLKRYDDEMEAYNQQQKQAATKKGKGQTESEEAKQSEGNDGKIADSTGETSDESSTYREQAKKRKV